MLTFTTETKKLTHFLEKYPVLSLSLLLVLSANWAFWQAFIKAAPTLDTHTLLFSVSTFVLLLLLPLLLLHFLRFRYVFKPALILVLLVSASVSYFMNNYGIVIDVQMIHNTIETDANEVQDLLNIKLFSYLFFFGILPSLLVARLRLNYKPVTRQLLNNSLVIAGSALAISLNFYLFAADYASLFKNHHEIRYLINPANYIYSSGKYIAETFNKRDAAITPVGLDAKQKAASADKHNVLILVVGETARAQNFSLNGYNKLTNPRLAGENVINYPNFYSCGTSTHISLPCMFSIFKRRNFNETDAPYYENLTDVMTHAGINVLWRDNNSGCKGVCHNVETENMKHLHLDNVCNERECYDEVLLHQLKNRIESTDKDMFIVLHQNGSHGPAYYLRYPERFRQFTPVCETNELNNCSHEALVNTYDNTIFYTDYFLSRVIGLLKEESVANNTAMLYVSDHGESLGEKNIYLHSMPYLVAPEEQTHVPFISWFSDNYLAAHRIDASCIKAHASNKYDHDYLFHTVLGMMNVSSKVYDPSLDMYAGCKADSPYSMAAIEQKKAL